MGKFDADRGQPDNATEAYYDHLDQGGTKASWNAVLAARREIQREIDHDASLSPYAVEGGWF